MRSVAPSCHTTRDAIVVSLMPPNKCRLPVLILMPARIQSDKALRTQEKPTMHRKTLSAFSLLFAVVLLVGSKTASHAQTTSRSATVIAWYGNNNVVTLYPYVSFLQDSNGVS